MVLQHASGMLYHVFLHRMHSKIDKKGKAPLKNFCNIEHILQMNSNPARKGS